MSRTSPPTRSSSPDRSPDRSDRFLPAPVAVWGAVALAAMLALGAPASAQVQDGGLPGFDVRLNQDASGQPQVEISVAANPADPLNIVAAWIDFFPPC